MNLVTPPLLHALMPLRVLSRAVQQASWSPEHSMQRTCTGLEKGDADMAERCRQMHATSMRLTTVCNQVQSKPWLLY